MKPIRASVCGAKCCLAAILGSSLLTISVSAAPALKAFPTAEGFGANAVGGRGGRVIEVTTLEDSNGYTNVENYLNELAGDPIP